MAITLPIFTSLLFVQVSFQLQRGMLLTLRHPRRLSIYFIRCPVPHVQRCDEDPTVEKFYGDLGGNSPAYFFPSLYTLLEDSSYSTFYIFNSQASVRGALPHFHKLPLVFLLNFRTFSSSASLIYTSSP